MVIKVAVTVKLFNTLSPKCSEEELAATQVRMTSEKYVKSPVFLPKVPQNCCERSDLLANIEVNIDKINMKVKVEKNLERLKKSLMPVAKQIPSTAKDTVDSTAIFGSEIGS